MLPSNLVSSFGVSKKVPLKCFGLLYLGTWAVEGVEKHTISNLSFLAPPTILVQKGMLFQTFQVPVP
jgi:hypothetical protein